MQEVVRSTLTYTTVGENSSISGGVLNEAQTQYASISGGSHNEAIGVFANVSGGERNTASGQGASVSGGTYNLMTFIIVDQHIAQPGNTAPGHLTMPGAETWGQSLRRLPYDLKLSDDCILPVRGREENIATD